MMWMVLLVACQHEAEPVAEAVSYDQRVEWTEIRSPARVPITTLAAEVVPAPASELKLAPPTAGRLLRWHVKPGDQVVAGQALADLASPTLSALRARSSMLSSRIREARSAETLAEASAAGGVGSQLEVQVARAARVEAEADLAGVQAELQAHGASVGAGRTWVAPEAGTVGELECAVGPVPEGVPCVSLQRDRRVQLEVRVPARHLVALHGPLTADFIALDGSSSRFEEISRAPRLDVSTRSMLVQFGSDDEVLPGSAGRAVISAARADDLQLIPRAALTRYDGVDSVFVGGMEAPRALAVQVVGGDAERVLVRGLASTDQVAITGVFLLKSLLAQGIL